MPREGRLATETLIAWLRSITLAIRTIGTALAGWLDLLTRFSLAQAFLMHAAVTVMARQPPTMVGTGRWVALLNAAVESSFGFALQTICPVLLLLGAFSRFAALPLLFQALVLRGSEGLTEERLFWAVLLGWIAVFGAGPISLDRLFARGFDSSAVPGARRLKAAFSWVTARAGPWYHLVLRLWIATAPLGVALVAFAGSDAMRGGPAGAWLAKVPDTIATAPPWLCLAIEASLVLGLGARLAAVALLAAVPFGSISHFADAGLYWTLLLAIIALRGAGPLSLDRVIEGVLGRLGHTMRRRDVELPHVVIVGGGFGGIAAARRLKRAACRVTLVDQRNHHLFQPLLYQVATAALSPADIATPIRRIFRGQPNVAVLLAEVTGVSPATCEVLFSGDRLSYDYLILATGARHGYFGHDEWSVAAPV